MTSVDIYAILASKPHNHHYLNRYWKFIQWCQLQDNTGLYTESHHICPKSKQLFPEFKSFKQFPWNKVNLTSDQHIIAHIMLWKAYGGWQALAVKCMLKDFNNKTNKNLSNRRIPDRLTRRYLAKCREESNTIPRVRSMESRKAQSERMTGVSSGPKSAAHKKALSDALIGKKHSEERRLNQSLAKKGVPLSPEHLEARIKGMIGKTNTPETIEKSKLTREKNKENGKIHGATGKGWSQARRDAYNRRAGS